MAQTTQYYIIIVNDNLYGPVNTRVLLGVLNEPLGVAFTTNTVSGVIIPKNTRETLFLYKSQPNSNWDGQDSDPTNLNTRETLFLYKSQPNSNWDGQDSDPTNLNIQKCLSFLNHINFRHLIWWTCEPQGKTHFNFQQCYIKNAGCGHLDVITVPSKSFTTQPLDFLNFNNKDCEQDVIYISV